MRRVFRVAGALLALLPVCAALVGCPRRAASPAAPAARPGWTRHEDPLGFRVEHPEGWRVDTEPDAGVWVRSPDGTAFAHVQPFLLADGPAPPDAPAFLRESVGALGLAGLRMGRVRPGAGSVAAGEMAFEQGGREMNGAVLASLDGRAGMLYAVGADRGAFASEQATLARILESFVYARPATGSEDAFYRWTEPTERMFSLDVPRGWTVTGGLTRYGATDARTEVRAVSPDGRVRVFVGDASVPPFTLPTETLRAAGFREDTDYDPGLGVKYRVRAFRTGEAFAREYVYGTLAKNRPGLTMGKGRTFPVAARKVERVYAEAGGALPQVSVGAVRFAVAAPPGGAGAAGLCLAGTVLSGVSGMEGGLWTVNLLYGYEAPPDREGEAQAVLRRMGSSLRVNAEWVAAQAGLAGSLADTVSRTSAVVGATLAVVFSGGEEQASRGGGAAADTGMTAGLTEWRDPASGAVYRAATGRNYYWQRGKEAARPNVDLRPLASL